MESSYNYKNCQSLFGYSANVHLRCEYKCQLCGCGGKPVDFDIWRQMTVEHLIGKSQGGYLKQIKSSLQNNFSQLNNSKLEFVSQQIDALNTVSACQFCNSTTSRDSSDVSMDALISDGKNDIDEMLISINSVCNKILEVKKEKVKWKLKSIKKAFNNEVLSIKINK